MISSDLGYNYPNTEPSFSRNKGIQLQIQQKNVNKDASLDKRNSFVSEDTEANGAAKN